VSKVVSRAVTENELRCLRMCVDRKKPSADENTHPRSDIPTAKGKPQLIRWKNPKKQNITASESALKNRSLKLSPSMYSTGESGEATQKS